MSKTAGVPAKDVEAISARPAASQCPKPFRV